MKNRKYISPEFEKFKVELLKDCLDASSPGYHGVDLGEDDPWADPTEGGRSTPLNSPDPSF